MKPLLLFIVLNAFLIILAVPGFGAEPLPGDMAESDFIRKAFAESLWKAEAARLAARQAASGKVRRFGEGLAGHYSQAAAMLQAYGDKAGILLPGKGGLMETHTLEHLGRLHGAALDREFMNLMISELQQDLILFQEEGVMKEETRELRGLALEIGGLLHQDMKDAGDILRDLPYSGYRAPSQPED